jgi:hypothetical protein
VLYRFNEAATKKQIDDLMAASLELKNDIPGIERVAWGENFSPRANGITHAVTFEVRDRAALKVFYEHPAHKLLAQLSITPIAASLLVIDYEERRIVGRA